MKKKIVLGALFIFCGLQQATAQNQSKPDDQIRVVAIFAHPDDADSKMSGTAALWAEMGAAVKFVSLTNGDAGHFAEGGGALGKRRRAEAQEAAKRFGIDKYVVLDNHDGELLPDLNVRKQVIREIREWDADIVLGLRPNDYHPDHRNAGKVVQDAAYMVIVPNVVTDVPALEKNPVFLYMQDHFKKPNPFSHDIVVAIDKVLDKKVDGLDAHTSQMYEWLPWVSGTYEDVPEGAEERKQWLKEKWLSRKMSEEQREGLEKWYGRDQAADFTYAESFEIAEYGRQPTEEEIRELFPMLKK
jgi:LmbE family N-acetylglucosaminyl deacetylase